MAQSIGELINTVKQYIQDEPKQKQNSIKTIQNEIDAKENQIRELFAENIDSVIKHYLTYHETVFHHRKIETECEDFAKHLEKAQKLNAYDELQIERIQKNVEALKAKKQTLAHYRSRIKLASKAVLHIKEEKYNNAIKLINEYKGLQSKQQSPLNAVLPVLEGQVQQHLRQLLAAFWQENTEKMLSLGSNCYQKMSSTYQEKLNIYQVFFGSSSTNSLINRGNASAFRCTVLNKQTSSRILKSSEDSSTDFFSKVMVRVNVQMSSLKKVKAMVVQLKSQGIFNEMLRVSMRSCLERIERDSACEKEEQLVQLLSSIIGLLLIKKEIAAFFDLKVDQRAFLSQVYLAVGRELRKVVSANKSLEAVVSAKGKLLIFHRILTALNLNHNQHHQHFNLIVADLLKLYNSRSQDLFEHHSTLEISRDNLTHFTTSDGRKADLLCQTMDLGSLQFKFTSYVAFVLESFMQVYTHTAQLLEESDINHSAIYESVSDLYEKVLKVYGAEVLAKDQHYEIIQGEVNIIHVHKIYRYLVRQLEIYHGVVSNSQLYDKYDQLMVRLTRNILQVIQKKLAKLMEDYSSISTQTANATHHQFVEWTLEFVYHIINFMKDIGCPNYEEISIESMREMCELYWQYLRSLKQINLLVIYNLDLDLSFIYKYCNKHFTANLGLLDKFKSLRQFYALMLMNNINDLLDPQKRTLSYPNLSMELLLPMLKKYAQSKATLGKVRELKKKDVEALLKKLTQPSK